MLLFVVFFAAVHTVMKSVQELWLCMSAAIFGSHLNKQPTCSSLSESVFFFQDQEKMKIKKLSSSPEPEEVQSMVNYARNVIEEFRKAKHFRHILSTLVEYFLPPIPQWSEIFLSIIVCLWYPHFSWSRLLSLFLDSLAPPSELLEMCELSMEKMGAIFADTNVYMLHMMYQAMGVCLYMQDWSGAMSYGEKIVHPYRLMDLQSWQLLTTCTFLN